MSHPVTHITFKVGTFVMLVAGIGWVIYAFINGHRDLAFITAGIYIAIANLCWNLSKWQR